MVNFQQRSYRNYKIWAENETKLVIQSMLTVCWGTIQTLHQLKPLKLAEKVQKLKLLF